MSVESAEQRRAKRESPWTPEVVTLLRDWSARAAASADAHYALCTRLSRSNIRFGVPVVVLTTFVGTSVFATLQHHVNTGLKIVIGLVSVLAAVLASLQTFLRFGERAEKHRTAAEAWADLRRDMEEMIALHPTYPESRGDPKKYLDEVRQRFAQIAQQSPEMGEEGWWRPQRRYHTSDGAPRPISSPSDAAQLTQDVGQRAKEDTASP
ncbi:MAG TPA: SLATT domain-containing protein [Gaiellaceae bacterium]|jgi:hypothetical protein|nr:SLATT domain-containing protein [Gaiellaceae bacterium]